MSVVVTRGNDNVVSMVSKDLIKTKEEMDYNVLTDSQYKIYAKQYLKDNIMQDLETNNYEQYNPNMASLNTFFEKLPDELLVFNNEESMRLLLKYICNNLKYCFGISDIDSKLITYYMYISNLATKRSRK